MIASEIGDIIINHRAKRNDPDRVLMVLKKTRKCFFCVAPDGSFKTLHGKKARSSEKVSSVDLKSWFDIAVKERRL